MEYRPSLDHLVAMTDEVGIIQHAVRDIPNRSTGYCVDDVARAFIVTCRAAEHETFRAEAVRLSGIYLAFLMDAQLPDGRFHNFRSYEHRWLDDVGTPDSIGRAIWALGYGMRFAPRESRRRICDEMFDRALPVVRELQYPRSQAYAAIGLSYAYGARGRLDTEIALMLRMIVENLKQRYREVSDKHWEWFENGMTYDNARLCEALLRAGIVLGDEQAVRLGLRTLRFYESVVFENGIFVPIGSDGWYVRGGKRARYAQQPLEAASMVDVELCAAEIATKIDQEDALHRRYARQALEWFHGRNTRGMEMAVEGGGCYDGLGNFTTNPNMGAESTLACLWSTFCFAGERSEAIL